MGLVWRNSTWDVNVTQVRSTIKGMIEIPSIVGVKLRENIEGVEIMMGTISIDDEKTQKRKIIFVNEEGEITEQTEGLSTLFWYKEELAIGKHTVGEITIFSSTGIVFKRVQLGFLFIIVNSIIKTAALWMIFLIVGRFIVK